MQYYCILVRDLDACLCLQLLPFISVLLGDATNGVASLLWLVYLTILCTNKIDLLQCSYRDRLTNVESIFTIIRRGKCICKWDVTYSIDCSVCSLH